MKTLRTTAVAFAVLLYGTSAWGDESTSRIVKRQAPAGITAAFYGCLDKAGSDAVSAGDCLASEKQKQDTRVNRAYKALMGKLDGKAKEQLVGAERAWLDFQDKSGSLEAALYGSDAVDDLQLTQNELFRLCERANALEKYLSVANDR